jgi:hypothetical protein
MLLLYLALAAAELAVWSVCKQSLTRWLGQTRASCFLVGALTGHEKMQPNPALKTCIGELSHLQPLRRAMSHAIQTHETLAALAALGSLELSRSLLCCRSLLTNIA